ncbi:hypothetical protein N7U66_18990 [Lacinutrix neustonica]|uniref:Carboxypeptidase-like regulatory domain-containing protein n=1 Tax=Lacinutrix neustonica TaxID=2980107 RepID=A0A9E8SGN6_9FLAO|nr:hypothetical protein [Lacinutrix neustonica]WAC01910.1 hypothetical protein N7U66_18990 [Lacinutrix neustonica]
MKNQFNLNIKTPCSEHFNQFTPTSTGGFCGSCEKEVIDFTKMTTQEIINYFETHHNKNTCGRFKSQQLETRYRKPIVKTRISLLSGISLAILSFFSITATQAQNTTKKVDANNNTSEVEASKAEKNIIVKGYVTEQSLALPSVNVVLEGTAIGVQTDFDGYFEFRKK